MLIYNKLRAHDAGIFVALHAVNERRTAMVRTNVVASLCLAVAVLAGMVLAGDAIAGDGEKSEMGRNFEKASIGMTAEEMLTTMGKPSKTLTGREGENWTRAYVWEKRKHIIAKETSVAVFDGDRVVMLIHSSGGLDDVRERINKAQRGKLADIEDVELACTSEKDAWAAVPYMVSRLNDESGDKDSMLDAKIAASFDQIKLETSEDDIVNLLGEPTAHKTKRTESIYNWKHDGENLVVIFENGELIEKSLETQEVEFTVKEGYWFARNKDSGTSITVYL
jgi:hypothetical protein